MTSTEVCDDLFAQLKVHAPLAITSFIEIVPVALVFAVSTHVLAEGRMSPKSSTVHSLRPAIFSPVVSYALAEQMLILWRLPM